MTLEEYEAEERRLVGALNEVRAEILRLKHEAAPVHVGDIVRHKRHGVCKVSSVDVRLSNPWVRALKTKQDGTFGNQEVNLYSDWELVKTAKDHAL